jgi:N-acetylmuramoyl-L-alanine amidase
MARMPGARWLGEHSPKIAMHRYDIVCVHTIVGFAPAHAAHFSVHHDGTIDQSRDTRYRSGANLEGNHRIIAIENEDHGSAFGTWNTRDGHAVPAFTTAQIEANARILAWAHKTHGIPLQLCPNSRSTSRGLAYHRQGIDGNFSDYDYPGRVSGGETWTNSFGKVCPGDRRISARDRILARARQIVSGTITPPPTPEEDVSNTQNELIAAARVAVHGLLKEAAAAVAGNSDDPYNTATGRQVRTFLHAIIDPVAVDEQELTEALAADEEAPPVP